jgi:hypothetical protein
LEFDPDQIRDAANNSPPNTVFTSAFIAAFGQKQISGARVMSVLLSKQDTRQAIMSVFMPKTDMALQIVAPGRAK